MPLWPGVPDALIRKRLKLPKDRKKKYSCLPASCGTVGPGLGRGLSLSLHLCCLGFENNL